MKNECCATCCMPLAEESVVFGGMLLNYCLFACNDRVNRFRLCVTLGSERCEVVLGNSIDSALQFYREVLGGRVTPCALPDVCPPIG